ncbi:MAG: AAA family ATPase [bacterium]|nr:AAA family ATPase [bacterium]MCP4799860.1 AAA family ATPase [bacterium]
MLLELRISNLAIVDDLSISFAEGLTVITGETGAGKSIIAGGLSLLLGAAVTKEFVRHGESEAYVEAIFEVQEIDSRYEQIKRKGIRIDSDGIIVLRREIRREGRGRVLINGLISSLSIMSDIASLLISVQSQDQKRELGDKHFALNFLDQVLNLYKLRKQHAVLWKDWRESKRRLNSRITEDELLLEHLEYISYQCQELTEAGLEVGEEEQLADQLKLIRNLASVTTASAKCSSILDNSDPSVRQLLASAISALPAADAADRKLNDIRDLMISADSELSEASILLNSFQDSLPADTALHDELESRESLYLELKRKYNLDTAGLIDLKNELQVKIDAHKTASSDISQLESNCDSALKLLKECSRELHDKRASGCEKVADKATLIIQKLDLPDFHMKFDINYLTSDDYDFALDGYPVVANEHGVDNVGLSVCTNSGEKYGKVADISSGGEQSRIFLGLLSLQNNDNYSQTLLLDEADAGLGLDSAQCVARLLKSLSVNGQVICITHLPTMAVAGDYHLQVEKVELADRKVVSVTQVSGDDRVVEVARLLGGQKVTDSEGKSQFKYAEDLLSSSI